MRKSTSKPFIVRFDDWTAYKLKVMARDADHALEIAQAMSTGELWEADVIDGGQEHWEAFPAPDPGKAIATQGSRLPVPSTDSNWSTRIHLFNALEISPCVTVGDATFGPYIEVCDDPADAEFWSVYGRHDPRLNDGFGGAECFEDFPTEAEARSFAERLCQHYPHLHGKEAS